MNLHDDQTEGREKPVRAWWWWNNLEASNAGRISILALVETVLAVGLYIYVAVEYGTLHLFIAAVVAPFLLMRTKRSTLLAVSFVKTYAGFVSRPMEFWQGNSAYQKGTYNGGKVKRIACLSGWTRWLLVNFLFGHATSAWTLFATLFLGFVSRIGGTIVAVITCPVESLRAIPGNWWRFVSTIDFVVTPEFVPDLEKYLDGRSFAITVMMPRFFVSDSVSDFRISSSVLMLVPVCLAVMLAALYSLPAYAFRLSMKGSSIIYSPLIYLIRKHETFGSKRRSPQPFTRYLKDLRYRIDSWLLYIYAGVVMFLFVTKVWIWMTWDQMKDGWRMLPGVETINAFIVPESIPVWHWVALINAFGAWVMLIAADRLLARSREDEGFDLESKRGVRKCFQWAMTIRTAFTFYTIGCFIYIAAWQVEYFTLPPLGGIVPWEP